MITLRSIELKLMGEGHIPLLYIPYSILHQPTTPEKAGGGVDGYPFAYIHTVL